MKNGNYCHGIEGHLLEKATLCSAVILRVGKQNEFRSIKNLFVYSSAFDASWTQFSAM